MSIKEKLENNIVWWSLIMLVVGFMAGIGVYEGGLRITNQTTVTRDTFLTKDEVNRDYVKKSDCKSVSDGGGEPRLSGPAASEIEHRVNEALKTLKTVENDLEHERYDAGWILQVTVDLLNDDNSKVHEATPNLNPEFKGKLFQNLIGSLQLSPNSSRSGIDKIQSSFNTLKDVLLPAAPDEPNKNNEATRKAIADARLQLNSIKEGLGR